MRCLYCILGNIFSQGNRCHIYMWHFHVECLFYVNKKKTWFHVFIWSIQSLDSTIFAINQRPKYHDHSTYVDVLSMLVKYVRKSQRMANIFVHILSNMDGRDYDILRYWFKREYNIAQRLQWPHIIIWRHD